MQSQRDTHGAVPPLVLLLCCLILRPPACPAASAEREHLEAPQAGEASYSLDEFLLREEVRECLGIPYRRGGSTQAGMDCSGFSKHIYSRLFGVELPHKASEQYRLGIFRDTSKEPFQTGDLVFFKKKKTVEHVGIYLADGKFVHAVGGKGVVISNLENPFWKSLLAGSRRLIGLQKENVRTVAQAHYALAGMHFDEEAPFFLEIGYQGCLAEDFMNIRLSAFWERSPFESAVTLLPSTFPPWTSRFAFAAHQTFFQSGWSLASEIGLFQGFRLRPSLTLIDRQEGEDEGRETRGVMGLEALLTPSFRAYNLSMAFDYRDRVESAPRSSNGTGGADGELSLSLSFRYRVKNLMRVSFAGQYTFGDLSEPLVGSSDRGRAVSDLFLLFDFNY